MSEVIAFPAWNNEVNQDKWNLGAHFESEVEASVEVVQELYRTRNWLERMFMEPQDLLEYLNTTRERIEQASTSPIVVSSENVIPRQAVLKEVSQVA